uniref:Uncharacterized protein n=1 Tax=Acrobeloides nanus TaxID=290746 RepID=A0A914BXS8_9BILA
MEIVSPNSNSTSNFFIPTKDSSNDSINGCNFKTVIEPSPNIENFKDNIVPKFANGFFKPDMFMGPNLEKKKRGRPRKIDPNLSFSDSSSNISSIPPSPQSYNKEIYPQNGSNIDFNNIISAPGSQYSPYTNTTSETIDDLTLPSDETYEQMFKMINSACQEARSFYKESRGLKDFPDIPSTSKEVNRSRRKSMSNHQMTSPNGKMDQRRKSESLSKNLQSPQGIEDFGFKLRVTIRLRKS